MSEHNRRYVSRREWEGADEQTEKDRPNRGGKEKTYLPDNLVAKDKRF